MRFLSNKKYRLYLLSLIFLFSILIRWLAIKDYKLTFWFDQSRDAYISEQIIANHDLKILGPSASGTNDTVYHGVLYYYFIAPFYYFGNGNPIVPTMALSILGALGIFPLFYFSRSIFSSEKTAWLAVLGYVVSTEIIQLSHWLSNPSLAVMPLIVFYWSLWEVAYKNNKNFILLLAIALGICLQSALWLICLLGPLLIGVLYNFDFYSKKSVLKNWKYLVSFALIVFLLVSTIIFGQFMLWQNNVFKLEHMTETALVLPSDVLRSLFIYFSKMIQSIVPAFPIISFILGLVIFFSSRHLENKQKIFFISWISAPFWLYIIQLRNSIHILISLEIAMLMLLAWFISNLCKTKRIIPKIIASTIIIVFVIGNLLKIHDHRLLASSIFSPQQGTDLSIQIKLIDYTYMMADGQDFSFSTFSNPNGYYITWAYLYNWYGKSHYSYLPTFVGPNQQGLFGEELLSRDDVSRNKIHFTIIEPNLNVVPIPIHEAFSKEQEAIGPIVDSKFFGSTLVQIRQVKETH